MKRTGLSLGVLFAGLAWASAQVSVEVLQEQQQFLMGESMPVAVRIVNRSGQTLHLGSESNWLTFSAETGEGTGVSRLGEPPVAGEFVLESSKMATKRVDLAPYFAFTHFGRYNISATVHIKDWDRDVASNPASFNVIEGAKLWEQEVGLPKAPDAPEGLPEVRRYILQQANYLKGQLRLYLRVTDNYGKVFRVFPIGSMVSFGRPNPQVDKASNLHVLYQNGPYTYSYTVFSPNGDLISRQTYDYVGNKPRPQLRADEQGNLSVRGGSRRVTASDFPPPPSEDAAVDKPQTPVTEPTVTPPAEPTQPR